MSLLSSKAKNNSVMIHYYDSFNKMNEYLAPLIVCPGLSETAEEYIDLLEAVLPRRCIVFSFRGRGKSDTPNIGYNLSDHVSDIHAVVRHTGIKDFHLFGYSRGVSYALGYAQNNRDRLKSMILGDYPPEHRAMAPDWPEVYINNYLIPDNRSEYIRPKAVLGIQRESSQIRLEDNLEIPVLVARGLLEESLVKDIDLDRYKKMFSDLTIKEYSQSGHDIKEKEKELFFRDIIYFLNRNE